MRRFWIYILIMGVFGISILPPLSAQEDDVCPPIITDAIMLAGESCDDLGRNSACYGHNQVMASFSSEDTAENFSEPADIAELADVVSISTAALNADESVWGLALMNVQANIPDTIPGQAVLFFLMGETEVENRATQLTEIVPTNITITASERVNIRSGAGRNFNALGTADPNSVQSATGISEDGEWVRVVFDDADGWISRSLITPQDETAFNNLPIASEEILSPMQAFYFTTGAGSPTCKTAPDALVIQSPERLSVNLTINGAKVKIGSTIVLTTVMGDDTQDDELADNCRRTEAIVLDGELVTNRNSLQIPIGHSAFFTACTDENGDVVPQDDWEADGIVSEERLAQFAILETLPEGLLHYPIRIPTRDEIEEALRPTPAPNNNNANSSDNTNQDNNDDDDDDSTSGVDCSNFYAVSPSDEIQWGVQEFRWSPAVGAEFYYFTLVRNDNLPGSVFISQVGGVAESVFADVGMGALYQVGRATDVIWQVEAWAQDANGQYYKACSTDTIRVRRNIASFTDICNALGGVEIAPNDCRDGASFTAPVITIPN
ncbi:MAG: SH3 domain-containing protein [Anaerolineae bacterium]|nr:SH3 domain-containing protein [Anaerolineae bacterium]